MTSPKQIEANRKNAAYSTGPQSAAGKAAVSQNAVRHGLRAQRVVIDGESQVEFDDFRNCLIAQQAPADLQEVLLVDRIAAGFWRLRRTGQIEAQIFDEMRQSLCTEQKQATDHVGDPRFDDILLEDFPLYRSFYDFEEADADFELSFPDRQALPDAIAAMKERCRYDPQRYDCLSELEQVCRSLVEVPQGRHSIPAFRQYLQGLYELLPIMSDRQNEYQAELVRAIGLSLLLEESIERRRKPNLGQTLHRDFKGANILDKFTRYESQIERGLFKAMHELQRLQARRRNDPVCPPIAVDMDISGDPIV